jgi:hypothetical protein
MKLLPSAPSIQTQTKKISVNPVSGEGKSGHKGLVSVKSRVINIEKLLGRQNKLYTKQKKKAGQQEEKKSRAKQEDKLEKPKKDDENKGKKKLLKGPKLGFLDRIKSFIGKILLGFIAFKMIDYLPQMIAFLPKINSAATWIANFGIGTIDALSSFVKGAYDLRTKTIGFIDDLGGQNLVNTFSKFEGAVETVITTLIFAAAAGNLGGGPGGGRGTPGRGGGKPNVVNKGFWNERTGRWQGSFTGRDGAYRTNEAARRYAQRFGRDAAVNRFGQEGVRSLGGKYARSGAENLARKGLVSLAGKGGAKAILGTVRPLLKRLPIIGALIDFGLSVALGESPGRAAFKAIGAGLLGSVGAAIGSVVPIAGNIVGGIVGGMAGDAIGGALYDMFFGNKKPQQKNQRVQGKAGGGITRGGRKMGAVSRSLKREKSEPPRIYAEKSRETKINVGSQTGGKKKVKKIFPESKDSKNVSPMTYIEDVNKEMSTMPFLGPLFGIAYKTLLGDKANSTDYRNVAGGLDRWTRYTFDIKSSQMRMAGGGEVDVEMLMKGQNMTQSLTKNIEGIISSKVTNAISDLRKQLGLKKQTTGGTGPSVDGDGGEKTTSTVNISGGDADFWTLVAVASREDGEPQSWADVAQSIYNRLGSGAYSGSTIKELVTGRMQYEPTWKFPNGAKKGRGNSNDEWFAIKDVATAAAAAGMSQNAMKSVAAAILNPSLQDKAREFIQGRTDFRGYSVEGGLTRKPGDNYFGWYNNYTQNKVAAVPNFGAAATVTRSTSGPGGGGAATTDPSALKINKKGEIYLHWNAAGNNSTYGAGNKYHALFTGDGSKYPSNPDYSNFRTQEGHTAYRNSRGIGLAVAAMKGYNWSYAPTKKQLNAMTTEAATIAKAWGWKPSDINIKNVMTHAEAASGKDGRLGLHSPTMAGASTDPDNYGPTYWNGDGERSDLHKLSKGGQDGSGGGVLRSMIKNRMYYGGRVSGRRGQDMIPVMLTHGEFILDVNSTQALEDKFPGFLDALNHAKYDAAIGVLRNYASYESGAGENAVVPVTVINNIVSQSKSSTKMVPVSVGSGGGMDDYSDALAAGQ